VGHGKEISEVHPRNEWNEYGMRIGLNLLYLLPGVVGGTETYATHLIEALSDLDRANDYLIFVNREAAGFPLKTGPNFKRIVCPVSAVHRGLRYGWEQAMLPLQLQQHGVDVVHSLGYVGPLWPGRPHVITIHDLNYRSEYVAMSRLKRRVLGGFVEAGGERAAHVLTLSDASKAQIVKHLRVPPARVTTTHLAPDAERTGATATGRAGDANHPPYIIVFGGSAPHKNIPRLIAAFASVAKGIPHSLMIVGHVPADGSVGASISRSGVAERIRTTGYLTTAELAMALRNADLLAFPSLYEGFGLPVLDAQAAGVPVVCSSFAALPEVAGDGALLFDPLSTESIATALVAPISDPALRRSLIAAGTANVARFSWTRTAGLTLDVYLQLMGSLGHG